MLREDVHHPWERNSSDEEPTEDAQLLFRKTLQMKRQQEDMDISERTNKPDEPKKKILRIVNKDEEAASSDNHVPNTKRRNIEPSRQKI